MSIHENGECLQSKEIDSIDLPPLQSKTIQTGIRIPASDKEIYAMVEWSLATDTLWAKAGHKIAWDQFELSKNSDAKFQHDFEGTPGKVGLTTRNEKFTFLRSGNVAFKLDNSNGQLVSINANGTELLHGPMSLNFWRPPTDNDRGNKMPKRCKAWKNAGPMSVVTGMTQTGKDNVSYQLRVPVGNSKASLSYTVLPNQMLDVSVELVPQGELSMIPKIGMQCHLDGSMNHCDWFGNGPGESYCDRKSGVWVGKFKMPVDEMFYHYSKPQESGNRTDVRWMKWSGANGKEFCVSAKGDSLLETSCYPSSMQDLQDHKHAYELPPRDFLTVNIDCAQMGLAGDNSWGALPLKPYRIQPNKKYQFQFRTCIKN